MPQEPSAALDGAADRLDLPAVLGRDQHLSNDPHRRVHPLAGANPIGLGSPKVTSPTRSRLRTASTASNAAASAAVSTFR